MGTMSEDQPNVINTSLNPRSSLRASFRSPATEQKTQPQFENMADRLHPRYMTPTAASRAQASTPETLTTNQEPSVSTGKRRGWMASAAKRVGSLTSAPRSKKEGKVYTLISPKKSGVTKSTNANSNQIPNNSIGQNSYVSMPSGQTNQSLPRDLTHDSIHSSPPVPAKDPGYGTPAENHSPTSKPLPSLPIATVQAKSPIIRRSLIDAQEKPLRRSFSPALGVDAAETSEQDWPALSPVRATMTVTTKKGESKNPFRQTSAPVISPTEIKSRSDATWQQVISEVDRRRSITSETSSEPSSSASSVEPLLDNARAVSSPSMMSAAGAMNRLHLHDKQPSRNGSSRGSTLQEKTSDLGVENCLNNDCVSPLNGESFSSMKQRVISSSPDRPKAREERKPRASKIPKRLSVSPGPLSTGKRAVEKKIPDLILPILSAQEKATSNIPRYSKDSTHAQDRDLLHAGGAGNETPDLVTIKSPPALAMTQIKKGGTPLLQHRVQFPQDQESESEVQVSRIPRKILRGMRASDHRSVDGDVDSDVEHKTRDATLRNTDKAIGNENGSNASAAQHQESQIVDGGVGGEVIKTELPLLSQAIHGAPIPSSHSGNRVSLKDAFNAGSISQRDVSRELDLSMPASNPQLDRVKRLSAFAPEYGPVLRVSESAERIIMGISPEKVGHESPASKRNSVPDFRRLSLTKEMRKSTGELLSGLSPLSRSLTTRSLSRLDSKDNTPDSRTAKSRKGPDFRSDDDTMKELAVFSSDPFVSRNDERPNMIPRVPSDWPLRRPSNAKGGTLFSKRIESNSDKPWISPPAALLVQSSLDKKSSAHVNTSSSRHSMLRDQALSGQKPSQEKNKSAGPDNVNRRIGVAQSAVTNGSDNTSNDFQRFPPRTSSRPETGVSARDSAQVQDLHEKGIPNRFETIRPKQPPRKSAVTPSYDPNIFDLPVEKPEPKSLTTPRQTISKENLSSAKGMLSGFRGLFQKRSDSPTMTTASKTNTPFTAGKPNKAAASSSSRHRNLAGTRLAHIGTSRGKRDSKVEVIAKPQDAFPSLSKLEEDYTLEGATIGTRMLDYAMAETDVVKRARYLQMSKALLEVAHSACEAEACKEQAKQAATKAEMHAMAVQKAVLDLSKLCEEELAS